MIKKNMNILYNEVESIRRKLVRSLKYFGHNNYRYDVCQYSVFLKNGKYFTVALGTKNIPKVRKKDIAYILKTSVTGYFDSDRGSFKFSEMTPEYNFNKFVKYDIDINRGMIDTGEWD